MNSLFIDTHDKKVILALYKDGNVIDSLIEESSRHHSDLIMPSLKKILDNNNIDVHDLNEIIVVNGPGSFTGVRLGVTIAKTLAYTLNINVKTITSLETMMVSSDIDLPIIKDTKGVFGGLFDKKKLVGDYFYKTNEEFKSYIKENNLNYSDEYNIDFDKIYEYTKDKESINPHSVNPIYIKIIEALKND